MGETITTLLSKNADTDDESKPFITTGMCLELETYAPERAGLKIDVIHVHSILTVRFDQRLRKLGQCRVKVLVHCELPSTKKLF